MTLLAHRTPTPVAEHAERNPSAHTPHWRSGRASPCRCSVYRRLNRTNTTQALATEGEFAATAAESNGDQLTFHWRITFELSRGRRWDTRARTQTMYRVPAAGPWWPAVGPRL